MKNKFVIQILCIIVLLIRLLLLSHKPSFVKPTNMNDADFAISMMSILVVCGRFRHECPLNVENTFSSFLREMVLPIPAVAPLMTLESILLYIAAIVGASSLHSVEGRDSATWDLSMRSVLIRCQEIIISSSHDEVKRNKYQKMLLTTAWLFVKRHSEDFAEHNPWIEMVNDYMTTLSVRPEDILEVDQGSFRDPRTSRRAKIAARIAYSHFTQNSSNFSSGKLAAGPG